MPDGGEREAHLTADYNAEMIEHIARYPAACATGRSSSATPTTSWPTRFGPGLPRDPRLDRGALRLRRLRHRLRPRRARRPRAAARRARLRRRTSRSASSPSAARASARPAAPGDRRRTRRRDGWSRTCGWSSSPARASTRRRCPRRDGVEVRATCHDLYRAPRGLRPRRRPGRADDLHGADGQRSGRSSTSRCGTTSSRTSTSATGSSATAPAGAMDFATRRPGGDRRRDRGGDRTGGRLRGRRAGRRRAGGGVDRGAPLGGDRPQRRWRCRGVTRRDTERSTLLPWMSTARMLTL